MAVLGLKDCLSSAQAFLGGVPDLRRYPLGGLLELMVACTGRFPGILQSWDGVPLEGGGRVSLHVEKKLFDLRVPSTLSPSLTRAMKLCALNIAASGRYPGDALPFHDVDTRLPLRNWHKDAICQVLRTLQVTNVNMIGVDLSGGDLAGVRFFGQYHGANFMAANLKGALLSSGFKGNNFDHSDLRHAMFSGYFEHCTFKGAKVNTVTLKQARTELIGAVLTP
ncbi:pentapeptide repeat-containing protein [Pseudomonas gingeri NCPPB 3146 = LMG 5327]|uniref:Pentapeptide repeat-containing protein n=3 Tax=Pseudomonas TaxID=286 RepID=A0A7Y7Y105_9PSED|nr:pentapeptide repeat-containing protein [Pseudomonas gingeri]PNQ89916.1 pentapeptide repeat-containing protein [Pseudomonas gingeri NCPPB 3146 = LMG 5327]NVZ26889.1 pentapeptide repeat-containing protein [Pseudomonas gingeri]NVZ62172.1 pentapeptide repeat-containing protein [Pseudomonas gingeri]NVZ73548.1 pentapeptide repeat-containing protein [Pseudomonas gingeri]NWA09908.1 pentapeptide repeat-containing protein [Pseudomonas gingeri]